MADHYYQIWISAKYKLECTIIIKILQGKYDSYLPPCVSIKMLAATHEETIYLHNTAYLTSHFLGNQR